MTEKYDLIKELAIADARIKQMQATIGEVGGAFQQDMTDVNSLKPSQTDNINPKHYRNHPSGIECITITRHCNFNIGNAIKYLWSYKDKNINLETQVEDLEKAVWYIKDEIQKLKNNPTK